MRVRGQTGARMGKRGWSFQGESSGGEKASFTFEVLGRYTESLPIRRRMKEMEGEVQMVAKVTWRSTEVKYGTGETPLPLVKAAGSEGRGVETISESSARASRSVAQTEDGGRFPLLLVRHRAAQQSAPLAPEALRAWQSGREYQSRVRQRIGCRVEIWGGKREICRKFEYKIADTRNRHMLLIIKIALLYGQGSLLWGLGSRQSGHVI
ncbi:hypothetical protein OF83DRAFT_1222757 [Amylostereum chailletii]|nr:hypothetical protein OF83DRAFT_1222757 [Amylostereum chailletii]